MVGHTDIAPVTCYTRATVTPTRPEVTGLTERPNGVTVTRVTSRPTVNVPVGVLTLATRVTLHIVLTLTLARVTVTDRVSGVDVRHCSWLITLTRGTSHTSVDGIPPVARTTDLAPVSSCVVDTLQTLASYGVTVAGGEEVDVAVTLALDTGPGGAVEAVWITVAIIHALLAPGASSAWRTLGTHWGGS